LNKNASFLFSFFFTFLDVKWVVVNDDAETMFK